MSMIQEAEKPTSYDVLKKIEDHGLLDESVRAGIISTTQVFHKMVYEMYLAEEKIRGSGGAAQYVAMRNDISERMVYYIVKKMN